mmetsp:Transcript_49675/g.116765  ORF Transcript_49675/g.116765 Transcript_49675/m.116765 type:complete len:89 (+) Transcript_49675:1800-2066(+)
MGRCPPPPTPLDAMPSRCTPFWEAMFAALERFWMSPTCPGLQLGDGLRFPARQIAETALDLGVLPSVLVEERQRGEVELEPSKKRGVV